jgi:hypothetical protein
MSNHRTFLAYAPRGAGLMCALVYQEMQGIVHGWWTGARDSGLASAFFKLEDFYTPRDTPFFATEGGDLYGGWRYNYASSEPLLDKPVPVADDVSHELDRLQFLFSTEWLFFMEDEGVEEERRAYERMGLPLQSANIKSRMLNRLDKGDVVWTYWSKEFDRSVLEYLMPRWPLDYGK